MTIRVRLKGNKASVRFGNQMDEMYFVHMMVIARDRPGPHPKVSVKDRNDKEIPPLPVPKAPKVVEKKTNKIKNPSKIGDDKNDGRRTHN